MKAIDAVIAISKALDGWDGTPDQAAEKIGAAVAIVKAYASTPAPEMTPADKDREEATHRLAKIIVAKVAGSLEANPTYIAAVETLLCAHDYRIRAEAKAEAPANTESLKREIDLCYSMWTGRDYGHLPLHEALGKAMADREDEALREAADRVEKYMDGNHPPHYYSVGVHNALMGYSAILAATAPAAPEASK